MERVTAKLANEQILNAFDLKPGRFYVVVSVNLPSCWKLGQIVWRCIGSNQIDNIQDKTWGSVNNSGNYKFRELQPGEVVTIEG